MKKTCLLLFVILTSLFILSSCECNHDVVIDKAIAPTCTQTGLAEGTHCAKCDEIITPQTIIAATGHTEVIDLEVKATYTTTGLTEGSHCSICQDIIIEQKTIPTILKYSLLSDGTYEVLGFGGEEYSDIVIPSEYNGKIITSIGVSAFSDTKITSVFLPDTITTIKNLSFSNCQNLKEINLPRNLKAVANDSFNNCPLIVEYISDNIVVDTVWGENKKIYMLNSSIQIKQETKLTILPGTYIIGNGEEIKNFGEIYAKAFNDNSIVCYNTQLHFWTGDVELDNVIMQGGGFGTAIGCNFKLLNCQFYNSDWTSIYYPNSAKIEKCFFENWGPISIMTSSIVLFNENNFINCGNDNFGVIYCSQGTVHVSYNNFINSKKYALSLRSDGNINAQYNWFGTTDTNKIEQLIYDGNDNFEIENVIDYYGYLDKKYE